MRGLILIILGCLIAGIGICLQKKKPMPDLIPSVGEVKSFITPKTSPPKKPSYCEWKDSFLNRVMDNDNFIRREDFFRYYAESDSFQISINKGYNHYKKFRRNDTIIDFYFANGDDILITNHLSASGSTSFTVRQSTWERLTKFIPNHK